MKIIFIQDYIGRETAMQEKKTGDELDCGVAIGLALIELGVAEEVEEEMINVQTLSEPEPVYITGAKKRKTKELGDD